MMSHSDKAYSLYHDESLLGNYLGRTEMLLWLLQDVLHRMLKGALLFVTRGAHLLVKPDSFLQLYPIELKSYTENMIR